MVRRGAGLLVALGALLALSACEPPPAQLDLSVTTTADGRDTAPGDGVCEVHAGLGDCSLRAAVDEADANPVPAVVHVPSGTYALTLVGLDDSNAAGDLDLAPASGSLVLTTEQPGVRIDASAVDGGLDARSGNVTVLGFATVGSSGAGVTARSGATVTLGAVTAAGNAGAGVAIEAGGSVRTLNATVSGNHAGGIANAGSLTAELTTVTANTGGGITGPGSTSLDASVVADQVAGADCSTAVASAGWNLASDASCGLAAATDQSGVTAGLGPLTSDLLPVHVPVPGSPVLDVVPEDTGRCAPDGALPRLDEHGTARPLGGACERGAVEVDLALHLVVDNPGDVRDQVPGDGRCDIGDGSCTVRAAIDEANTRTTPPATVVTLQVDPVLSLSGVDEDLNATGDLDVTADVRIDGQGHAIDAGRIDRVVDHHAGHLTVDSAVIRRGWVEGNGGGIRTVATLTLRHTALFANTAALDGHAGGGLFAAAGSVVDITDGVVRANASISYAGFRSSGGGISSAGRLSIERSTIDTNSTTGGSGRGAGLALDGATVTIDRSTIADNDVRTNGKVVPTAIFGGGIFARASTATVTASTISGNQVLPTAVAGITLAGPVLGDGAAVHLQSGNLTITASTVAGNRGLASITEDVSAAACGRFCAGATTVLRGSIISPAAGTACSGAVTSGGFNVVVDSSCSLGAPTDHESTSADLGPLAANGGATRTHLPSAPSPAIDAIPTATPGLCEASVVDQRGVARPGGAACDAGAVEGAGPALAPLALVVTSAADAPDGNPGDGVCATVAGPCTLRAAIDETNARPTADSVAIAVGVDPVLSIPGADEDANATGDLDVVGHLALHGNGATIDGAHLDRVLQLQAGALTADHLTVTGGLLTTTSQQGAGVWATGDLALDAVTIDGNQLTGSDSVGGGVFFRGAATITASTISHNASTGLVDLLGDHAGGGIADAMGPLVLRDSTVSGNAGGGLFVHGSQLPIEPILNFIHWHNVRATVTATTFIGNEGYGLSGPDITVAGTIIASPPGSSGCSGGPASGGYNLDVDGSCALGGPTDVTSVDARLTPLADHGGPTRTHQPYADSPVLDVIPVGTPGLCDATSGTDQRGAPRPLGSACDLGSVEGDNGVVLAALDLVVDSPLDVHDATIGDGVCATPAGACTLRAALDEVNSRATADRITIAAGVDPVMEIPGAGESANASGSFDVSGDLDLVGQGATIDARQLDQVVVVESGRLTASDLTISGGRGIAGRLGGGIAVHGALTGERLTVSGNRAENGGGLGGSGELTLSASTIAGNTSRYGGGGLSTSGTVSLTDTTVRDNVVSDSIGCSEGCFDGGGVRHAFGTLHLQRSTVSGNRTAGDGGGIAAEGATLVVDNSTISGNAARTGAAVFEDPFPGQVTSTTIRRTTIEGNVATGPSGVNVRGSSATTVTATVIDARTAPACDAAVGSGGFNVVFDTTCGVAGSGDQQGVHADLAPLGPNGGLTETHLAYVGSPVLDRIPTGTAGLCDTGATDQRGLPRPVGSACDAGAAEGDNGIVVVPATFVVDDAGDTRDAAPGDGTCADGFRACTLRAAVDEANALPTPDVIILAIGIDPVLTRAGADEDANATGDLDVLDQLTIQGNGGTVDAAGLDRAFDLQAGAGRIVDLTITGGDVSGDGGGLRSQVPLELVTSTLRANQASGNGGGFAALAGPLTVDRNVVDSNQAAQAGDGAHVSAGSTDVVVTGSSFTGNSTTAALSGDGGGLDVQSDTSITISTSRFTGNHAPGGGGGGLAVNSPATTVTDSELSGNTARQGAGLVVWGDATLRGLLVADNEAEEEGGGVAFNSGSATVEGSTITGNTVLADGDPFFVGGIGDGAGIAAFGDLVVRSSTIRANVLPGALTKGGGVWAGSSLTVENSTISGNEADDGAGVYVLGPTTLARATIAANIGPSALYVRGGSVNISATIIDAGASAACADEGGVPALVTGGYNLVSDASCALTGATDHQSTAALLGALAANGGPTLTHLPAAASAAVDAIPTGTAGLCDASTPVDQRGAARPAGAACDIGAVER